MIRIIATIVCIFLPVVASYNSYNCEFKHSNGQYHYIAPATTNLTYSDFLWINATNHTIAAKKSSSVAPVNSSSLVMLVSSRNLGNLTLKRYYDMGKGVQEETVLCNGSLHTDSPPNPQNQNDDKGGGQSKILAIVLGVFAAVAAAVLIIVLIKFCKIRRKKKKVREPGPDFHSVPNPPNGVV